MHNRREATHYTLLLIGLLLVLLATQVCIEGLFANAADLAEYTIVLAAVYRVGVIGFVGTSPAAT